MSKTNPVTKAILAAIKASGLTPSEINNGRCWWLAYCVKVQVPKARIIETASHSWIFYEGALFDAESPKGIKDPFDFFSILRGE